MSPMQNPTRPTEPARLIRPSRLRVAAPAGLLNPRDWMSPRIAWALLQATAVIAVLLLVSGAGSPAVALEGRGDPAAARAVEVLIGRESIGSDRRAALLATVPDDYASVMGYRPVVIEINGILSLGKPIGACSSPVRLAFDMEPTCKGHDFGYDLLRYAALIDAPLGTWARPLIDDWWYAEMHQRCDLVHTDGSSLACHGQVLATEALVNGNTWREGYGPPIEENPWRYLGALALLPLTLMATIRFRRGDLLHPAGRLQTAPTVPVLAV